MTPAQLARRFPGISYLEAEARRRTPHFAWEYLASGTGLETALARNRTAFDGVLFRPSFLTGIRRPDLTTTLFGRQWAAPIGIAPVGLVGLMWPGAELMLARAARAQGIPSCLSMMACESQADVAGAAGDHGWFQLYPFADRDAEAAIVRRAAECGFSALVVTVDVPVASTRERQRRAGMSADGGLDLRRLLQVLARPRWALATRRRGAPQLRILQDFVAGGSIARILARLTELRYGALDLDHLARLRDQWRGPLLVKGVLDPGNADLCVQRGVDAVIVSNHGGRQLDAAPAAIDALPAVCAAVGGRIPVLFDSGIRTGLDVARALARGADFVLAGRAFIYGACVAREAGVAHVADLLKNDLANNMMQIGAAGFRDLSAHLVGPAGTGL